ncbi:asparagine synthase (glutamine-hydrolyzing) [Sphingomonas sp. 2SG]|uniref:asparagine synthase (glutamine-hydrolyzing) n=1 Tax=Sphingomonas sp. 2SG TaxID=2502201 RepID=UPI0010F9D5AA|nr:asparagine synthase (glutamine-hydrolyzing) [Sphingomonas sp. 2SG]
MCGICGFWGNQRDADALAGEMALRIEHRGPDSTGVWADTEGGIALAHCRLAIVDLSPAGHQPMASYDGRYQISYNGEIYNHLDLRAALNAEEARTWRGHSDTETLVEAISRWGVETTLKRINGMFAVAIWDRDCQELHLARDRMGEKPLYWGRVGKDVVFSSELKAMRVHPQWTGEINRDVLALYFRHNYIPGDHCIYQGLYKLPPGHWVTISQPSGDLPAPRPYWSLRDVAEAGINAPFAGSVSDAVDALETLLLDAVGLRMIADVPLGAFLSGGVDSSTIVALMQAQSQRPVQTFSIGFNEAAYDEAPHARAVAAHLGTDHTELYVSGDDAIAAIASLPDIWDEPFADPSQIPTVLLSRLTRQAVTVSLSGDGGDELFYGYGRYDRAAQLWSQISAIPAPIRRFAGTLASRIPLGISRRASKHIEQVAQIADMRGPEDLYHLTMSFARTPERLVLGATEPSTLLTDPTRWLTGANFREQMMYLDAGSYLPDDVLVKVDRASMAVGLESRVPLLDHRVVEFAWSLPLSMKAREGSAKWALREVLYRHVPKALIERPKMGFGVPIDSWLTGPLRNWAEALLTEERLNRDGYLNPAIVRRMWEDHQSGARQWHFQLWGVLMFQMWLDAQ